MPRKKAPLDAESLRTDSQLLAVLAELAKVQRDATTAAIEAARPTKITVQTRKKQTPWSPKNGEPRLKLKRRLYQHAVEVIEDRLTNEDIALANKLRPGRYCDGFINVIRRRDKGIDIDYPIKTAPQRMKLNEYGLTTFTQILARLVDEAANPRKTAAEIEDEY